MAHNSRVVYGVFAIIWPDIQVDLIRRFDIIKRELRNVGRFPSSVAANHQHLPQFTQPSLSMLSASIPTAKFNAQLPHPSSAVNIRQQSFRILPMAFPSLSTTSPDQQPAMVQPYPKQNDLLQLTISIQQPAYQKLLQNKLPPQYQSTVNNRTVPNRSTTTNTINPQTVPDQSYHGNFRNVSSSSVSLQHPTNPFYTQHIKQQLRTEEQLPDVPSTTVPNDQKPQYQQDQHSQITFAP